METKKNDFYFNTPGSIQDLTFLQNLIDGIPCGVGLFRLYRDQRLEMLYLNEEYYMMLGTARIKRKRYEGFHVIEAVHPEDRKRLLLELQKSVDEKRMSDLDIQLITGDEKQYRWIHIKGRIASDAEESTVLYIVYSDIEEKKQLELHLQASSHILEVVANTGNVSMWKYDLENNMLQQDPHTDESLGYPNQIPGGPGALITTENIYPEDVRAYLEMYERIRQGAAYSESTVRVFHQKKKKYEWQRMILSRKSKVGDAQDDPIGFSMNVELQKEVQAQYEWEQQLQKGMMEESLSYYRMNLSAEMVEEAYSKLFDASSLTVPMNYWKLLESEILVGIHKDDREQVVEVLQIDRMLAAYQRGKTSERVLYRRWMPDGELHWVKGTLTKTKRTISDDIIAFWVEQDVDQEVKDENAVRCIIEEEIELFALYMPESKTCRYLMGSLAAKTGKREPVQVTSLLLEEWLQDVLPEDRKTLAEFANPETLLDRIQKTPILQCLYRIQMEDGSVRRKKVRAMYLDENETEIIFVQRDITDLYREELRQKEILEHAIKESEDANKAKTNFLSRMSHDMRTPLNGIMNYSAFIQEAETLEDAKNYGEKIKISGDYLQTLINDTLGMSRIESGKVELKLEPYIYSEFEPSIRNVIEPKARAKGVKIRFIAPDNTQQYVMLDKMRLQQIFVNLLNNAIKFTPPGGIVQLKSELTVQTENHENIRFTVSDTGIGMSEEFIKNRLFQPFSQEHPGRDNEETGTGLGLSIVKQLVELMHGTIECRSRQREGTTFIVTIPVDTLNNYEVKKSKPEKMDLNILQGKRVMLCEDHPLNREIAVHILHKAGCVVESMEDGEKGVAAFENSAPNYYDLILMDIRMPVMDGLTAARAIRSMKRKDAATIPIIAMTANAFEEDARRSFDAGMNAHLAKPIQAATIYETMIKYLENA
ncbi:MAG: ATP-binding protein [Lachnospiraceae bacterium]|nr:ATP-binding protein [Lachnospiraceae bacterium]